MFFRGRLRDSLGGCCGSIDLLLKRSLLLLEEGVLSVEEPNMDSVSDGAAVLLPNKFMVMGCGCIKKRKEAIYSGSLGGNWYIIR